MKIAARSIYLAVLAVLTCVVPFSAHAQSAIAGDIAGTVTDPTGAVVVGATVSARNTGTSLTYTARTNGGGTYHLSAVQPGPYVLTVTAAQLKSPRVSVTVSNGQVSTVNVKLGVAATTESVSVNGAPPLLQQDSGNIATTLTEEQLNTFPNPGQSLSNLTMTMPGTTMVSRTTGTGVLGYASTYGLPAVSNVYSVDGDKGNDPVTSGPLDGALNTLIGQGDIQEVTVTTIGNAEYGYLSGAQIDAISKSGTNKFHGDAYYGWNGRVLNANDYFNNLSGVPRSFDNVNQSQASVGGPIYRNKTFFFADYEYYSLWLPTSTQVYIPSPAFETSTLASIPTSETSLYQEMFKLYNNAPGASGAVPLVTGGVTNPDINTFRSIVSAPDHETYVGLRGDQIFSAKDSASLHVKIDRGLQTAYIDPISSIFNVPGPVPITDGQISETHIFGPRAVNQAVFAAVYYNETFPDPTAGLAALPLTVGFTSTLPLTSIGGDDSSFPEGHRTFDFILRDNFSYQVGKHTVKVGILLDHANISDANFYSDVTPAASETLSTFESGTVSSMTEAYPLAASVPLSLFMMDPYVQDDWKVKQNLTINAGIRLEHDSNPVCKSNCNAHFAGSFASLNSSSSAAYNQLIAANQRNAYPGFQAAQVEPRIGFAWTPFRSRREIVVRGSYGLYADEYSAYIAESFLSNLPNAPSFTATSGLLAPGGSGSAVTSLNASDAAFTAGFSSGGSYSSISTAVKAQGGSFSVPSFSNPAFTNYPVYNEYNFGIQQELAKNTILDVRYVGTNGHNGLLRNPSANAYDPLNSSDQPTVPFTGLPTTQPNPNFGEVIQYTQDNVSNYNGLVTSVVHRSQYITAQINYTYSHAFDDVSNGGRFSDNRSSAIAYLINPLSTADNYGNADYDVRHDLNANYILTMPHVKGPSVLVDGWQLAGTVFANSGFPYSVTDSDTRSSLGSYRYDSTLLAKQLVYRPFKCTSAAVTTSCLGSPATATDPDGTYFATATGFGSQRRDQLYGPNFFDTDLSLFKSFALVHYQGFKLKLGAQFYNVLNHPNFTIPSNDVRSSTFGTITSTVGPPVNLLGSNLGGDASPRMIEFTGRITF